MLFLYRIVHFIAMVLLKVLHPFNEKVKHGYLLRQKKQGIAPWLDFPKKTKPIWIHCSSGEFEYALPVIRQLKKDKPTQKILVTYFTPSYLKQIEREPLVDMSSPAPWDSPSVLKEFIEYHQPTKLLIARTDFWPEMIEQCQQTSTPIVVFSMTFNKTLKGLKKWFLREQFRKVQQFLVVSEDDKLKLSQYAPSNAITVCGDTRYEQCLFRLEQSQTLKINSTQLTKPLFLAGSTWPEDEQQILPALKAILNTHCVAFVPHEISQNHLNQLTKGLEQLGLDCHLYSQINSWGGQGVLIVDEYGLLAHLYKLSHVTFVGGSFKKRVHSVMESLACGNLTFVGPYHHNNREAVTFSTMTGFHVAPVIAFDSTEDLQNHFKATVSQWTTEDSLRLQNEFKKHSGAALLINQEI